MNHRGSPRLVHKLKTRNRSKKGESLGESPSRFQIATPNYLLKKKMEGGGRASPWGGVFQSLREISTHGTSPPWYLGCRSSSWEVQGKRGRRSLSRPATTLLTESGGGDCIEKGRSPKNFPL